MRLAPSVLLILALTLLVAKTGDEPRSAAATQSSFVTRSGTQLMLDDHGYHFTGLNIYNANSDGWCANQMNTGTALDDALTAIGPGKSAMRAWFFQPLATTGGARNWSGFDHTLAVAEAHGVRVIVTFTDQWGECGVLEDGGTNYYKTKDWYISGYTQTDQGMLVSYRDWVAEVVTRYKDNPTVLMWQLINEAEVKESLSAACLPGSQSRDLLISWATDMGGLVKSIDAQHLLSLGTIGGGQCGAQYTEYQDVHAIATIDICEYHDYGSPNVPMPGDQWNGLQFRINQCDALNKPFLLGETGIIPDHVDGTLAGRAAALDAKIEAQMGAGIDGILPWAWSNSGSTLDNYDIGPGDPVLDVLDIFRLDTDGDGFPTGLEDIAGTDPLDNCADNASDNAWPADIDNNGFSDTGDIAALTNDFGDAVPGAAPPRHNIAPDIPDGFIDTADIARMTGLFAQACGP